MESFFFNSPEGLKSELDSSLNKSVATSPFVNRGDVQNIFVVHKKREEKEEKKEEKSQKPQKRLNDLDGNILVGSHFEGENEMTPWKKFFAKFLPKIYQKKLVEGALRELVSISKIANNLVTKKIPYGEQDATYDDLIVYLSSASSIRAKLKGKL